MMEFVNGKDDIPYMKWKIKFMFQTTKPPTRYIVQEFYPFIQTQQGLANVLTIEDTVSNRYNR
jgi:hypothetical protein